MPQRVSEWSVIWAPGEPGALTLLSLGDIMAEEVATMEIGAHNIGVFDFGIAARPVARGGAVRRFEMSRVDEHAGFTAAWMAQAQAAAADPWGITAELEIQPRGGSARRVKAALMNTSHTIHTDSGVIETIHRYKFRVSRNTL